MSFDQRIELIKKTNKNCFVNINGVNLGDEIRFLLSAVSEMRESLEAIEAVEFKAKCDYVATAKAMRKEAKRALSSLDSL